MNTSVNDDCGASRIINIELTLSEVPLYLVDSELYRSFLGNQDGEDVSCSDEVAQQYSQTGSERRSYGDEEGWQSGAFDYNQVGTPKADIKGISNSAILEEKECNSAQVSVPEECLKMDTSVANVEDLRGLLLTLRYWISSAIPETLIAFCIAQSSFEESVLGLLTEFSSELTQLCPLIEVMQTEGTSTRRLEKAAGLGSRSLMRCVHRAADRGSATWSSAVCSIAAGGGHLDCLRYAHEQDCPWDGFTCRRAAEGGHIECLKYAHEQGCPWNPDTCQAAASAGHLVCLNYAHEQGCPWNALTCHAAAYGGHLECLKYAHEQGCPWNTFTWRRAAEGGHIECLKYAHEQGFPWTKATCSSAAGGGHLECLKYAHEQGCPWTETTCSSAAEGGHLDCLKYAHEQGCPWTETTCSSAAEGGHLDCLKYAHEQGCPWTETTCKSAAEGGHLDCLMYAHEQGCPRISGVHLMQGI